MARTKPSRNAWFVVLGIILLCVPFILSIAWGAHFGDAAYRMFLVAQNWSLPVADSQLLTQAPLVVGLMAAAGAYASLAGLVVSALGWSATAFLIFYSLRAVGRPLAAIISAVLLVFNPLVVTTSGTAYSWVLALGWTAVALTAFSWGSPQRAAWLKLALLFLLLGLHFNAATILFALALLAVDVYNGRAGWLPFILLAAVSFLWGFLVIPRFGSSPTADPILWLQNGAAFLAKRQLYWLYMPFVLVGLWDVWSSGQFAVSSEQLTVNSEQPMEGVEGVSLRQMFLLLLLWVAAAVLARDTMAPLLAVVTAVALAGLGAAWIARKVLEPGRLAIDPRRAALLVPALLMLPLLLVALFTLWDLYSTRPLQQAELQDQAAEWLVDHAHDGATLYAPPRVGYLAGLATIPAMVDQIRDGTVDAVYERLLAQTPDYIVTEGSFAWDYVTRTTWFQDRYQVRTQFEGDYASDSPVTVWEYTPSPFDEGQREATHPQDGPLPQDGITAVVDDRFALVGYQFEPKVITPGDDIFLTLYLQALEPVEHGFITGVHLTSPDGWVWAWREERTPRALSGQWWEPGQVIPERIRIQTTEDIPLGAYDLQVFWRAGDDKSNWPIVREGSDEVFDRIFLGYVVAPPPVDAGQATPVKAQFGEAILLDSYEIPPHPAAGEALDVTLYWQALSQPSADYTVFVHLVDEQGQVVAAHDGMPGENSFPTGAWPPGLLVSDRHQLDLPADLAPGPYQINVGMYLLETGERLPVWDAQGVEQLERSLPLAVVSVSSEQ